MAARLERSSCQRTVLLARLPLVMMNHGAPVSFKLLPLLRGEKVVRGLCSPACSQECYRKGESGKARRSRALQALGLFRQIPGVGPYFSPLMALWTWFSRSPFLVVPRSRTGGASEWGVVFDPFI